VRRDGNHSERNLRRVSDLHYSRWKIVPEKALTISGANRFTRRGSTCRLHAIFMNQLSVIWVQLVELSSRAAYPSAEGISINDQPGAFSHSTTSYDYFVGAVASLNSPNRVSLPRYGSRVGLRIVLFEACSGVHSRYGLHTRAVTVYRDTLSEGFSHFVTSMTAPVASGWSGCRVGLTPTGKRRLCTAHAKIGQSFHSTRQLEPATVGARYGLHASLAYCIPAA
jgi:hypothetical protein